MYNVFVCKANAKCHGDKITSTVQTKYRIIIAYFVFAIGGAIETVT